MDKQMKDLYCSKCKGTKPETDFYVDNSRPRGRASYCKVCRSQMQKISYQENKPVIQEKYRVWKKNNPNRRKEITKKHRESSPEKFMWRAAKDRAKKDALPFDITPEDIIIPDICPVLGIPLKKGEGRMTEHSPSLDKIIPHLGYVKGNIAVMSQRANWLKRDGTLKEIEKLLRWMKENIEAEKPPVKEASLFAAALSILVWPAVPVPELPFLQI